MNQKMVVFESAQMSLASSSKLAERFAGRDIQPKDVSRIQDAAIQAQQAAAHFNQLVGMLLAESDKI